MAEETGMSQTTDKERQDRMQYIFSRVEKMKQAKDNYSVNWPAYEKQWKMFDEGKSGEDSWRASLPDTWAYATVKTAQSAFLDSEVMPVFARREDEDSSKATDLRDLYIYISDKGDLKQELYYARLDAFKLGNGFLELAYVDDEREVHEVKSYDADTRKIEYEKKKVKDFDDPRATRVSPYLMFVDELCRANFNTARDCAKVEILGYEDAKRIYGKYVENWDKTITKSGVMKLAERELAATSVGQLAQTAAESAIKDDRVKTFRFFAPIEVADDEVQILHYYNKIPDDTYEIIIQNVAVKVKTSQDPSPNPFIHKQLPFITLQYSPYSGDEFWAAGIIETIMAEVKALQQHREMMSDRQRLSLFSPAFADVNSEIDQRQLKLKPLQIIRTKGGVPRQFQIPGITNADLALKKDYEDAVKRVSGVDERLLGSVGGKSRMTATEISFIRESSLARLREFMFLYKQSLIREVRLMVKMFEQYYSSPLKREEIVKEYTGVK